MIISRSRLAAVFFFALVLIFGLWCLYGVLAVYGIATPAYSVTATYNEYEVREYEPMILVTTAVDGTMKEATATGFKRIAAYIFGDNSLHQQIAMTTPVTTQEARESSNEMVTSYAISFVMPAEYSMNTLPLPNDSRVRVKSESMRRIAVSSFYGLFDDELLTSKMVTLKETVENDGYIVTGTMSLAQYNPPFTPWFLRKNEVWAEVLQVR